MTLLRVATIGILLGAVLFSQNPKYILATNFSSDLLGPVDTRADTWGRADSFSHRITFKPPSDKRVRILHVAGDFLAWPVLKGKPAAEGRFAGVLLGLQTTEPEGSVRADLAADNTFLYLQIATHGKVARTSFDVRYTSDVLLGSDHVLVVRLAAWLNDLDVPIHCEPSFVVEYDFVNPQDLANFASSTPPSP